MTKGFRLPLVRSFKGGRGSSSVIDLSRRAALNSEDATWARGEFRTLRDLGVLAPLPPGVTPRVISPWAVALNSALKRRIIVDLRFVNEHLSPPPKTRASSISTVASAIDDQTIAFISTDITKAFYHVPIHNGSKPYLAVRSPDDEILTFNALPMGLSWSPYVLSKSLRPFITAINAATTSDHITTTTVSYVDDFLFIIRRRSSVQHTAAAQAATLLPSTIRATATRFGWTLNEQKSVWSPTPTIRFLGFDISLTWTDDRQRLLIRLPPERATNLLSSVRATSSALAKGRPIDPRSVARLAGQIVAASASWAPASFIAGPLSSWAAAAARRSSWSTRQLAPRSLLLHLDEAKYLFRSLRAGRLAPTAAPPHIVLTTDASPWGWGAKLAIRNPSSSIELQGRWLVDRQATSLTQNERELRAVIVSIRAIAPQLTASPSQPTIIRVQSDNRATISAVARLSTMAPTLRPLVAQLHHIARQYHIEFSRPGWIPGSTMIKNGVDALSRRWSSKRAAMEWPIHRSIFAAVCQIFEAKTDDMIDRFATATNTVSRRFNSLTPEPNAEALDGLSQDWAAEKAVQWINPPFALLPRVINKIATERPRAAIVIVPAWPSATWWPTLSEIASRTIDLPSTSVVHPRRGPLPEPLRNQAWGLRAVLINNQ